MADNYSLLESILSLIQDKQLESVINIPGEVVSYDKDEQTAEIRLMVKAPVMSKDVNEEPDQFEEMPVLPNVPVKHPRGNGTFVHTPLAAGDEVTVHVDTLDATNWRATGNLSEPATLEPYQMSSCWATPGTFSLNKKLQSSQVDAENLTFGKGTFVTTVTDGQMQINGTAEFLARADKVLSELEKIKTAFANWTPAPVSQDGGAAVATQLKAAIAAISFSEPSTSRVKVDE